MYQEVIEISSDSSRPSSPTVITNLKNEYVQENCISTDSQSNLLVKDNSLYSQLLEENQCTVSRKLSFNSNENQSFTGLSDTVLNMTINNYSLWNDHKKDTTIKSDINDLGKYNNMDKTSSNLSNCNVRNYHSMSDTEDEDINVACNTRNDKSYGCSKTLHVESDNNSVSLLKNTLCCEERATDKFGNDFSEKWTDLSSNAAELNYDLYNYSLSDTEEEQKNSSFSPKHLDMDDDLDFLSNSPSKNELDYNTNEYFESAEVPSPVKKKGRKAKTTEVKEQAKLEKERLKVEKEKLKAKKKQEKKLKEEDKQKRKALAEKRRLMKPNECLKFITVEVDESLFQMALGKNAVEQFPNPEVKFTFKKQPVENAITWKRSESGGSIKEEKCVAVMWIAEKVVECIKSATLIDTFKSISHSYPGKTVVLWIFSLENYFRKSRNAYYESLRKDGEQSEGTSQKRRKKTVDYLSREDIEMGLTELQVLAGVSYMSFENNLEFTNLLFSFTKSVAEIPYREERDKSDGRLSWYLRGDSRSCVRVDKEMNGLARLWAQQLTQFQNMTLDAAKAIAELYPTPVLLCQAYEKCSSQKEKDSLLQNILVKRSNSENAKGRRLGPEMSRRISLLFTQTEGSIPLL